jgi:hypothetical protein
VSSVYCDVYAMNWIWTCSIRKLACVDVQAKITKYQRTFTMTQIIQIPST